jgi:hypothetical protein
MVDRCFRIDFGLKQASVGIACRFLIEALHIMGLATLTHTPGPKRPLRESVVFSRVRVNKCMVG